MRQTPLSKISLKPVVSFIILTLALFNRGTAEVWAQEKYIPTLIRVIDTSKWTTPSTDPMGIGYLPTRNTLLMTDSEIEEFTRPYWYGVNFWEIDLLGNILRTFNTVPTFTPKGFSSEPTEVTYNSVNGHYFFSDDDENKIFEVNLGADGVFGTADDSVTSFSTASFGSIDPEGVTLNTFNGHLLIADGFNGSKSVYDVSPGANGFFDGIAPIGDDVAVKLFDTIALGVEDVEGIDFNRDNGNIYLTGDGTCRCVAEVKISGELVRQIDISALPGVYALSGIAYAPSSINSQTMSLYLTDRGIDNDSVPLENDGKIYEISLPATTPTPTPTPSACTKSGDVNCDNVVNMIDIGIIVDAYGTTPPSDDRADLNNDNTVNIIDIGIVIDNYGL